MTEIKGQLSQASLERQQLHDFMVTVTAGGRFIKLFMSAAAVIGGGLLTWHLWHLGQQHDALQHGLSKPPLH